MAATNPFEHVVNAQVTTPVRIDDAVDKLQAGAGYALTYDRVGLRMTGDVFLPRKKGCIQLMHRVTSTRTVQV